MSSFKNFALGMFLSAFLGLLFFVVLMALGSYESRTGIEKGATPAIAFLGAIVIGALAPCIHRHWIEDELPVGRMRIPVAMLVWVSFLGAGALVVWQWSGGADLGPTGEGFQRDFRYYWEAAVAVFGCFLGGLAFQWTVLGIGRSLGFLPRG